MRTFKVMLLTISLALISLHSNAQHKPSWATETKEQKQQRMQWWADARLGMFIHWGLYALPARHEWVKNVERISNEDYEKYFTYFNPDLFNPREWARKAKEAGMKYFVITTKHHEGFCLFDSKFTDYKSMNTPIHKDLVKEMVDAFRAEGLRVGFYYSLIDWHHPDFPVDKNHPMRDNKEARDSNAKRDIKKYQLYLKNQLTELLTNYGKVDELFLDFSYPGKDGKGKDDWDSENLLKLIRHFQT
jgi:alpha-L-fucosidase